MRPKTVLIAVSIIALPLFCFPQTVSDNYNYHLLIPELKKKVKQNPYNIISWKMLFKAYVNTEAPDSAAYYAQLSEQYFPDNVNLYAFYSDLFCTSSMYAEAAVWIEKLYGFNSGERLHTLLVNTYHNAGLKKTKVSEWEQASRYFQKALKLDPASKERYPPAALASVKAGDTERALDIINQGTKRFGSFKQLFEIQRYIYLYKKDYQDLEKLYENYSAKNPDDIDVRLDLNKVRNVLGKPGDALADLKEMMEQFPGDMRVLGELSSLYSQFGKFELERQTYLDMLDKYQDADSLYLKIAHTYEQENNWVKAGKYYKKFGRKYPESIKCKLLTANAYIEESKLDSALDLYRIVIKKEPRNVNVLEQAGRTAADIHYYAEALKYFRAWSTVLPGNSLPLIAQAQVLQAMGRTQEAMRTYEDAEKIKGNSVSAFQLFMIYKETGDLDKAKYFQPVAIKRTIEEITEKEKKLKAYAASAPYVGHDRMLSENYTKAAGELDNLQSILNSIINNWISDKDDNSLEKYLQNLLDKYPHTAVIMKYLAEIYVRKCAFPLAERYYKKYISLKPRSVEAQRGLAKVYEKTKNDNMVLSIYMKIVELDLANEESYRSAIYYAEKSGELDRLAIRWGQLYKVNKDVDMLRKNLIFVWNKLGRNDKVREIIE